jgi:hypothetical protein
MVVVMVLLGLISSLTLPAMQRWHAGLIARAEASTVVEALQAAAFQAGTQRVSRRLDATSFTYQASNGVHAEQPHPASAVNEVTSDGMGRAVVTLPPGWRVGRVVPAVFGADGLCKPGLAALLSSTGTAMIFSIRGPLCRVDWTRDHGAAVQDYRIP